jgi:HD-like signal output (HDOD) protein
MTTDLKRTEECRLYQLSTLKLPTLPAGTPFLLKSLTNEDIDFIELATILENFPSIAGKLISLANSAWSAPTSEVTSLEVTCSRLGLGVVRSTSIALAIAAPFDPTRCLSFDTEYFWCSALMTADAASRLAPVSSACNGLEASTARAAGLLHNLALLWLVDKLPEEVDQALTMVSNNQAETLQQALFQVVGFDQLQAGGHLGLSWALPKRLVQAMTHYPEVEYEGSEREIVITTGLAVKMVSAVLKEEPCPEPDSRLSVLGITEENFNAAYTQLNQQLVKTRAIAKVLI